MKNALLTTLRDRFTNLEQFRKAADQLAILVSAESGAFLDIQPHSVETPLGKAKGSRLEHPPILVPILRAGLILLPSFLSLYARAPVGLIGIKRDEKTAEPQLYYSNIPGIEKESLIFLLDPMLATGQSAAKAVSVLKQKGADESKIVLFSILAAPEGLRFFNTHCPRVRSSIVQVDQSLTTDKWIYPGLGDFGDRYFGS